MANINEMLAWMDARRQFAGRQLGDITNVLPQWMAQIAEDTTQFQRDQRANRGAMQSVMPEVRQEGVNNSLNTLVNMGGVAAPTVFHGTQATKKWYDIPEYKAMMERGEDIPRNIADSTYPLDSIRGSLGGLKMMDGLGPHFGTAEAANQRLAKYQGVSPSKAWNKFDPKLAESYVMPFDLQPVKPFAKKDGTPYTEVELQSRLADIAESLGFKRDVTRGYSSHYPTPGMRDAQKAVKQWLKDQGYDAVPYINSHEARGSTSWVVLDDSILKSMAGYE